MSKISVFIATSLDGFIARENGDIEWLHNSGHGDVDNSEDYGYQTFFDSVDALVMGRHSFEKILSFEGEWPYQDKPVFVLTTGKIEVPEKISKKISVLSGSPREIIADMEALGYHHIYLDGGKTIQQFLEEGLIDELTITKIPILLGSGIPLFGPISKDIHVTLLDTISYSNGFVTLKYRVSP